MALLTPLAGEFFAVWGCPEHCGMVTSTCSPYTLTINSVPECVWIFSRQMFPERGGGHTHPHVRIWCWESYQRSGRLPPSGGSRGHCLHQGYEKYSQKGCLIIPEELCSGYSLWDRNDSGNCYHGTGLPEFNENDTILNSKGKVVALNLQSKCSHHYWNSSRVQIVISRIWFAEIFGAW